MSYHMNSKGEAAPCHAEPGNCPLGGDHYDSKDEAQAGIEERMSDHSFANLAKNPSGSLVQDNGITAGDKAVLKAERSVVQGNVFVTIDNADEPYGQPITETFSNDLSNDLQPGTYSGYYYDETEDEDVPVEITVNDKGQSTVLRGEDVHRFADFEAPDSPEKAARTERAEAVSSFSNSLREQADNDYSRDGASRLTMLESAQMIEDVQKRNDFSTASGHSKGVLELSELQEDLNLNAHTADGEGRDADAAAWWRASEGLSDTLPNNR